MLLSRTVSLANLGHQTLTCFCREQSLAKLGHQTLVSSNFQISLLQAMLLIVCLHECLRSCVSTCVCKRERACVCACAHSQARYFKQTNTPVDYFFSLSDPNTDVARVLSVRIKHRCGPCFVSSGIKHRCGPWFMSIRIKHRCGPWFVSIRIKHRCGPCLCLS